MTPRVSLRMPAESRHFPWLLALALAGFAVLLLAPPTGWLVRAQMRAMSGPPVPLISLLRDLGVRAEELPQADTAEVERALQAEAARRANDIPVQIAQAMRLPPDVGPVRSDARVRALRDLARRFPDSPSIRAQVLRIATQGQVRLSHRDMDLKTGQPTILFGRATPPVPETVEAFLRDAAAGERLDPGNAFFPAMRAMGLFAANRDREARAALHRAAGMSRFDDYVRDEAQGLWRLRVAATGERAAISRVVVLSSILFPHYASLRAMTRVAVFQAVQAEKVGNREEGMAIRRDILRLGGLMRRESSTVIGSLVGIALTGIAIARPGGAPDPPPVPAQDVAQARRAMLARFQTYARQIGHDEEAWQAQEEVAAGEGAKAIINQAMGRSVFAGVPIRRLMIWWNADLLVLSNAFWLLVLAVMTALLARTRYGSGAVPVAVAVGVLLLLFIGAWNSRWSETSAAVFSVINNLTAGSGMLPSRFLTPPALRVISLLGTMLLPVLLVITAGIVSAARRRPMAETLSRASAWAAVLLLLVYGGLALHTVRQEAAVHAGQDRTLQHEGRYMAALVGRTWPE